MGEGKEKRELVVLYSNFPQIIKYMRLPFGVARNAKSLNIKTPAKE